MLVIVPGVPMTMRLIHFVFGFRWRRTANRRAHKRNQRQPAKSGSTSSNHGNVPEYTVFSILQEIDAAYE